ncbi:MAG: glycosyltransferase family 2 protein [Sedimentisphaerales bacterium]
MEKKSYSLNLGDYKKIVLQKGFKCMCSDNNEIYFSVITPMYNRADTIRRYLDSCLSQKFNDYELIIIDDASQDDSVKLVESYLPNPRIKLLKNQQNKGVVASRAEGVKQARGKWFMFLDSDDAFNENALEKIHDEVKKMPDDIKEVRFCYWCDDCKIITPCPLMPEGIIDFSTYLKWWNMAERSDVLNCQRREIYDVLQYPNDRQYEMLLTLQIASTFKMFFSKTIIGTVYNDATNRITGGGLQNHVSADLARQIALDNANSKAMVLADFSTELKKYCPAKYKLIIREVGNNYMRAGIRFRGAKYLLKYLSKSPLNPTGWALLFLGLFGSNVLRKAGKLKK